MKLKLCLSKRHNMGNNCCVSCQSRYPEEDVDDYNTAKSASSATDECNIISGFKGEIITPNDTNYDECRHQYATSSADAPNKMKPGMIAYVSKDPNNTDIKKCYNYALSNSMKISVRSGGHQYSGLSSGDSNHIVIDMKNYNSRHYDTRTNILTVEPCNKLEDIYLYLDKFGTTIPAGECGSVNIGGHVQTGGYGKLIRSCGLLCDHVISFKIVLIKELNSTDHMHNNRSNNINSNSNPNGDMIETDLDTLDCREREFETIEVFNPKFKQTDDKRNDELFWAVLGSFAGSFGVVTEYKIQCIKNSDYSNSYGARMVVKYNKKLLKSILKVFEQLLTLVHQNKLESDLNCTLNIFSIPEETQQQIDKYNYKKMFDIDIGRGLIEIEMIYSGESSSSIESSNATESKNNVNNVNQDDLVSGSAKEIAERYLLKFENIENIDKHRFGTGIIKYGCKIFMFLNQIEKNKTNSKEKEYLKQHKPKLFDFFSQETLSYLTNEFASLRYQEREYDFPYKKRIHGFKKPWKNGFIDSYCDHIDFFMMPDNYSKFKIVSQFVLLGGKFKTNDENIEYTSVPYRNNIGMIVLDVFYDKNFKQDAIDVQNRIENDWIGNEKNKNSGLLSDDDIRYTWATFGNIDLSDERVWKKYVNGDEQIFEKLKNVKTTYDPTNVFCNQFTVPLDETLL